MRIWAFPSFYPYNYPGKQWAGIFAHRQYKGLIENGANLKVVVPVLWQPPFPFYLLDKQWAESQKLAYPKEREYDGIQVFHPRISNMKPNRLVNKSFSERYISSVINWFEYNKINLDPNKDIFYAQWIADAPMIQAIADKFKIKTAILGIGDDVLVYPIAYKGYLANFAESLKKAAKVLYVADFLGKAANKITGLNIPYTVIRRGVNYEYFKPYTLEEKASVRKKLNVPTESIVILAVGASVVEKGWFELLDALVKIKDKSNIFLLAVNGKGNQINLNEEAKKRDLDKIFHNLQEIEPSKMAEIYNSADIFCLPSHSEGIANVVVEAMSCGISVLTTSVGGHPELIKNGETGILIPTKDAEILSQQLQLLISDKALRETLGNSARAFIVEKWGSFEENAKKLYKILSEI